MFIVVPWKIVARPKVLMSTCCVNSLSSKELHVWVFGGEEVGVFRVLVGLVWVFLFVGVLFCFLGGNVGFRGFVCLFSLLLLGFVCCRWRVLWLCVFCGGFLVLWDFFFFIVWGFFVWFGILCGCLVLGLLFLVFPCLFCFVIFIFIY